MMCWVAPPRHGPRLRFLSLWAWIHLHRFVAPQPAARAEDDG